jgi:hypothetical protein
MLAGRSGARRLPAEMAEAIGCAIDMIRAGRADVVLAGWRR